MLKILFAGAFAEPIARAAKEMGVEAHHKSRKEPWFDISLRLKPELVVVDRLESVRPEFVACVKAHDLTVRVRPPIPPVADRPIGWKGGALVSSMKYDIACFSPPRRDAAQALDSLSRNQVRVALYHPEFVGRPEFVGTLSPSEERDARRSALCVFNSSGCPWERANCLADGGKWLADRFPGGFLTWSMLCKPDVFSLLIHEGPQISPLLFSSLVPAILGSES